MRNTARWLVPLLFLFGFGLTAPAHASEPSITIEGLNKEQEANVRAQLTLATLKCDTPQWRIESAQGKAPKEIGKALQALGYYKPSINPGSYRKSGDCWSASYRIAAGDPVHLAEVDVHVTGPAEDDKAFKSLLKTFTLKAGDALNHAHYESAKQALLSLAAERGYFDAQLTSHKLAVKPSTGQAWVTLIMDSGPRYRFGEFRHDTETLDPSLIKRLITVDEDEFYHSSKLHRLRQGLIAGGYFRQVEFHQQNDPEEKRVHIVIVLTERPKNKFGFGVGVATDTGPRVSGSYENRRVNTLGHRFKGEAEVSAIGGKLGVSYSIPLDKPSQEWLTFTGGYESEDTDTSERETFKLGAKRTKLRAGGWLETTYLELSNENYEIGGISGEATPLIPGISWLRTEKDNPQRIREGERLFLELRGAPVDFASGSTFAQIKASGFWITSPLESGRLLARAELGTTWAEDSNRMAVSNRFFAGGDRSIRGYDYQTLGPKDSNGKVIGGSHLVVASLEYEQIINDQWGVATFIDSGNAFDDKFDKVYTGVGVGLRWQSPIGPVRLDLAHPVDDPDNDYRIHIGIGPEF